MKKAVPATMEPVRSHSNQRPTSDMLAFMTARVRHTGNSGVRNRASCPVNTGSRLELSR